MGGTAYIRLKQGAGPHSVVHYKLYSAQPNAINHPHCVLYTVYDEIFTG